MIDDRQELASGLMGKSPLLLTVEVGSIEEADQIMQWMFAPEKPMLSKLVQIRWDCEVVPTKVVEALRLLKGELTEL